MIYQYPAPAPEARFVEVDQIVRSDIRVLKALEVKIEVMEY